MGTEAYRAGIVGLGMIGGADQISADALGQRVIDMDGTHYAALSGAPRVKLVAGATRDAGRRSRFAARSGAAVYPDVEQMLAAEQLDILSIATYTPAHVPAALAAVEGGVRAIFCEKPLTQSLEEGHTLVQACEKAGVLLVANHQRRFSPSWRRLRRCFQDGTLGELTSASAIWGKGRLGNVGTHVIDAIRMASGQEVVAVSGYLDPTGREDCRGSEFNDPGGWGMLKLSSGQVALLDGADAGTQRPEVTFNTTSGRVVADMREISITHRDGQSESWPVQVDGRSSMDRAVTQIVEWLDRGGEFAAPGADALKTFEVIVALHTSHERNTGWVQLPLDPAERTRIIRSG